MLVASNVDDIKSIEKCRNIVSEINNFGVNDNEIIKIIELLSFELENTDLMRKLLLLCRPKDNISETKKEKLIL